jgi:hypothetical protein
MTAHDEPELRPAYRTLDDPTRLLGVPLGGWAAILSAGGMAYAWLLVSPLGWRANLSVAVIGLGAPLALGLLREQSTISPGRLLVAVVRWRARPAAIVAPTMERPVRRGGVRLDTPGELPVPDEEAVDVVDAVWPELDEGEVRP